MDAAFYFDLASPAAYLAAERILQVLPGPVEWQPVLARELAGTTRFDRVAIERRARELDLQALRWPADFPFDSALAMRAATYAKSIGRTVPFAQAAFRQAFAGGRSLVEPDNVLIAAAACEMHPAAVLKGTELASVGAQLSAATQAAARAGVHDVPALRIGARVFSGERALQDAARYRADPAEALAR
jgi:2-hydroxychromene-2-carboxylate isomerase